MIYHSETTYAYLIVSLHPVAVRTLLSQVLTPRQQVPWGMAPQLDAATHPCCYWAMTQGGHRWRKRCQWLVLKKTNASWNALSLNLPSPVGHPSFLIPTAQSPPFNIHTLMLTRLDFFPSSRLSQRFIPTRFHQRNPEVLRAPPPPPPTLPLP